MSASAGSSAETPASAASMPRPVTFTPPPGVQCSESGVRQRCAEPGRVRAGQRLRCFGDERDALRRVERAAAEHVVERVARHPLQHDVGAVAAVLDVEYLGQAGVGRACWPRGRPSRPPRIRGKSGASVSTVTARASVSSVAFQAAQPPAAFDPVLKPVSVG